MPTQPPPILKLTVSPARIATGAHQASYPVTLTNGGPTAVHVKAGITNEAQAGGRCHVVAAPGWVTVSPASFNLNPGQTEHATVIISAPASTTGSYDLGTAFAAQPKATAVHATGFKISGSVSARLLIGYGGPAVTHSCTTVPPKAADTAAGQTSIPWELLGLVLVALVIGLLGVIIIRTTRRGRPS
jgi:hypothetical protein